jgi:hypothetical protein
MKKYTIHKWQHISDRFTEKLLLGNGASRAVWDGFKYSSLFELATEANRISGRLRRLFSDCNTTDFEYILRLLSQTKRVNRVLHIDENFTAILYKTLKRALIDTIRDIHPKHEQINKQLLPMARFMKRFNTVLNLNYDLLVYWAMLEGNDKYGNWFKDGFVEDKRFNNDYDYLFTPRDADGATLVFYPHGSLILATDLLGEEVKLSRSREKYLLDKILNIWETKDYVPLFVSEGETEEKLQAIRRSNYLKTVYDCEVQVKTDSLVVYGWSFREEDEHILKGIIKGGLNRIAVSIHANSGNTDSFCEIVQHKINKMYIELEKEKKVKKKPLLYFFDSDSEDCWINSLEELTL